MEKQQRDLEFLEMLELEQKEAFLKQEKSFLLKELSRFQSDSESSS